jgi:EmrB/QacA subfamily drug resistance transporter
MMAAQLKPAAGPSAARTRWLALVVLVAAQFMVILDVAIVNVALPTIKSDLGFSQESLQWVITAYAIFFGGVLLLGGRLADLLGRRRLFMAGVAVFSVSSLLAGLAWSAPSLILFRATQGLGGALLSAAALAILMTTFDEGHDRNVALGIWGAASGSGAAVGVLLGGVLTSYLSWSWIFFVNVPVGAAVIAVSPWLLHESRLRQARRHFDLAGAATITGGLMVLVYALTYATQHSWASATTAGLLAVAAMLVAAFVLIEARSDTPLLPLSIFRLRTLAGANLACLLMAAALFSQFFLLTLYMQEVLHYSPIKTGLAYLATAGTSVAMSPVAQALSTRLGVRRVLTAGLLVGAAALLAYTRLPVDGHYLWDLLPAYVVSGVGFALAFVSVSIGGLSGVTAHQAGVASGLVNTSQQVGGAVGLAIAATISTTATTHYLQHHSQVGQLSAALTHGFQLGFYVLAVIALVGGILAAVLIRESSPGPQTEPVDLTEPQPSRVA